MANRWGNNETVTDFIFLGSKITADDECSHEIKRCLLLGRKAMTNIDSILKSKRHDLPTKVCLVKAMVFPVVMYGCESWTVKKAEHQRIDAFFFLNSFIYFNWRLSTLQYCSGFCHTLTWISQIDTFWAVVLEKSPLDSKETKPVNPKWNESWIFIGRTDAEAEAPIVWPPDAKSQLVEDKTVGWYHQLNGHEFEQALRDGEGQGSLVCCSPCGCKELDMTGWLNNDDSCF